MSTYTRIIYQIVFSTKNRESTLSKENRHKLFEYVNGILRNKKCHLYQINGVEDHVHIVTHVHPTIAIASLVKDIKVACSALIKERELFKHFSAWQEGYGAFTYSFKDKDKLIEYVKNQEQHHAKVAFVEEYKNLLKEHGIEFDERYLL
jgi:REP element-mobilizing transposase RayT